MKKMLFLCSVLALLGLSPLAAQAAYPEKAITCIVPFAAGGAADISVRMMADTLQKKLGQPLVIVNKGGGSGIPGLNFGLKAKPDGYTVIAGAPGNAFVATFFKDAPQYNLDDIVFAGAYMPQERILLAKTDKPYKTWEEFVAYAKAHPGEISVGSGASQEAMEVLRAAAIKEGLKLKYVMYKSGGEATSDLLGGHIDCAELGVGTAGYQAARAGELNVLANLGSDKIPHFEQVKSLKDRGYQFATGLEYGFVFPKGLPEEIRAFWENCIKESLNDPELREKMEKAGFRPQFMTGAEYKNFSKKIVSAIPVMMEYNKQDKN